jgi:hypothetical protein
MSLTLSVLPETFAVCQLEKNAQIPSWAFSGSFTSITKTANEVSLVCPEASVPALVRCERGWGCFVVEGPIGFSETGVLASIVEPLARARVSVFVVSTFETDFILVRKEMVASATRALIQSGHRVRDPLAGGQ